MKFTAQTFSTLTLLLLLTSSGATTLFAQSEVGGGARARRVNASNKTSATAAPLYESARSDKFTGGEVPRAKFAPGVSDVRITVDVPAFRLNLWQAGKIVTTYPIGIGLFDFQVPVGSRSFTEIVYNPAWIPPPSGWVTERKGVKAGEIITASDPRNPLGKMKIPLGNGYLIHEARGVADLGNLVSHGCIRMLRRDLYDLADKLIAARSLGVTVAEVARAKATKKTLTIKLDAPLPIDLDYDTQVIEEGVLYIYPDVYERNTNTVTRLRQELESTDVNPDAVDLPSYEKLLTRPTKTTAFATPIASVEQNRALTDGKLKPLVVLRTAAVVVPKAKRATRKRT